MNYIIHKLFNLQIDVYNIKILKLSNYEFTCLILNEIECAYEL